MGGNLAGSDVRCFFFFSVEFRLTPGRIICWQIHDFVENADGFAEVFPEHKYQVVKMLQSRGHLTAMTGDGSF